MQRPLVWLSRSRTYQTNNQEGRARANIYRQSTRQQQILKATFSCRISGGFLGLHQVHNSPGAVLTKRESQKAGAERPWSYDRHCERAMRPVGEGTAFVVSLPRPHFFRLATRKLISIAGHRQQHGFAADRGTLPRRVSDPHVLFSLKCKKLAKI